MKRYESPHARAKQQATPVILVSMIAAGVLGFVVATPRHEKLPTPVFPRVLEPQCETDSECAKLCLHDDYYCNGGPEGGEQLTTRWVYTENDVTYGLRQDGVVVWKQHQRRGQ